MRHINKICCDFVWCCEDFVVVHRAEIWRQYPSRSPAIILRYREQCPERSRFKLRKEAHHDAPCPGQVHKIGCKLRTHLLIVISLCPWCCQLSAAFQAPETKTWLLRQHPWHHLWLVASEWHYKLPLESTGICNLVLDPTKTCATYDMKFWVVGLRIRVFGNGFID